MKKLFLFFLLIGVMSTSIHSQLAIAKVVGKNAKNYKTGFGTFVFWDIPLNDIGNRSIMIELLDFAYFPAKFEGHSIGYASIKIGYKYIFSTESKTGFYIEPQIGYCRVASGDGTYGDGVGAAAEFGYSIEIGQRGNNLNFGLKYETDMAGTEHTISSVGFRVSYSFHMFRRRGD
jgi:hypothetical protein